MSFEALAWAAKQRPGSLAAKMVLLALANYADEHGCAYPSTAALADFGAMDHKTATTALDRLASSGLIHDTGERAGRTRQIKVYRLALESIPKTEASQKRKAPTFSAKAPRKRGTDTIREPIPVQATPSQSARADCELEEEKRSRSKGGTDAANPPPPPPARPKGGKSKRPLRDDWSPGPLVGEAARVAGGWNPAKLAAELDRFRNHAAANDRRAADWNAAWRNWITGPSRPATGGTSTYPGGGAEAGYRLPGGIGQFQAIPGGQVADSVRPDEVEERNRKLERFGGSYRYDPAGHRYAVPAPHVGSC